MAYIKCLRNVISSGVPNGKTVTPTDVVSTWLACGSRAEEYTTLSAVLADSTCLNALMASDNAVDYLVRSTTFANDIASNSGAMTAIGLNNYCANTLLADSDWCNAICNSTYFESVLNVKVPTMTSNTTPSGVAFADSEYSSYKAYMAFDGNRGIQWGSSKGTGAYVGYQFTSAVKIYKYYSNDGNNRIATAKFQASNDGSNWIDINSAVAPVNNEFNYIKSNPSLYQYYRFYCVSEKATRISVTVCQFYGRKDV